MPYNSFTINIKIICDYSAVPSSLNRATPYGGVKHTVLFSHIM